MPASGSLRRAALVRAALVVLAVAPPAARAQRAPYTVSGGVIHSEMQPSIRVTLDTTLAYVGSQRWVLYDVAQAEQHLFVRRGAAGVERFLWVQFEEYVPSSNGRYDYSGDAPLRAFGREWRASRLLWDVPTAETRPASDGAYARRMLRAHGLTLPPRMLYERFVYLPDASGRRELMVIYAEDAASRGALGASGASGASGVSRATLDSLLAAHERRALRSFAISGVP